MSQNDQITVKGAREHNFKNIDVAIPRTNWWLLPAYPVQASRALGL